MLRYTSVENYNEFYQIHPILTFLAGVIFAFVISISCLFVTWTMKKIHIYHISFLMSIKHNILNINTLSPPLNYHTPSLKHQVSLSPSSALKISDWKEAVVLKNMRRENTHG